MIDPWSSAIVNYEKLIEEFGIKPFHDLLSDIEDPHILMRRGIIFGHRDYGKIVKAIRKNILQKRNKRGTCTLFQLIWYQEKGAEIYIPIADMESYSARGIDFPEARRIAIEEYITNYLALGLDPDKNLHIYLTSENKTVTDLAYKLAKRVNMNEMKAIYGFSGSTNIAHIYAPMIQVADILHPQLEECGGPKPTVVPVGPDQDPHIRLTRDIAERFQSQFKFITPSSTYHRFITGLTGGKMSSSKPKTAIFLSDSPEMAMKKLKSAKTGGRESLAEQEKMGGVPEDCVVYEMLLYHLVQSDSQLKEIHQQCTEGSMLCGECKARAAEMIKNFFEDLEKKREKAKNKAETILDA